jgi:hypothetical protein
MGIFQKFVTVYNRTPVKLYVTFDGQREPLMPGLNEIPEQTVMFAKNQNPVMGSQDPNNPGMAGARFLVVGEHDPGFGVPMTKAEFEAHLMRPCRIDEEAAFAERYGNDPKARQVLHGVHAKPAAKSRYEAGTNPGGISNFEARD